MRPLTWSLAAVLVAGLGGPSSLGAQPSARRITTLAALTAYPTFFHGDDVLVRAESIGDERFVWLVDEDVRVAALAVPPPAAGTRETLHVSGRFWDVGRLDAGDPRLIEHDVARLSEALLGKPWPGVGELLLLVADDVDVAERPQDVTLRALALEPARYRDEIVTVVGRFRGRNLYGDMPEAPGKSRWDFVLASGDAAVWVVGKEPKGNGFELDVAARVDTNRWLEVAGTVRVERAMVQIEAATLAIVGEPAEAPETTSVQRQGPRPEVIFSAPVPDEPDIARDTSVRIQFSRDIDPETLDGHVRVSYLDPGPVDPDVPGPSTVSFTLEYRGLNRVLEIRFGEPLERTRTVEVELQEGILATDGAPLVPWTLRFHLGG